MSTAETIALLWIAVVGPLAAFGLFVAVKAGLVSWRARRARQARRHLLAEVQPFVASNGCIVELRDCGCGTDDCAARRVVVSDPDSQNRCLETTFPSHPGLAHRISEALRHQLSTSPLPEAARPASEALIEFFDRVAIVEAEATR